MYLSSKATSPESNMLSKTKTIEIVSLNANKVFALEESFFSKNEPIESVDI